MILRAKENRWIVDPLDGTTKLRPWIPLFSAPPSAYEESGTVSLGVCINPIFSELFVCRKDRGLI